MSGSDGLGPSFQLTVTKAIDGDRSAFEAIYHAYAGRLRAFGQARGTGDPEAVANDVMLKAFQNLSSFQGDEAAFTRWLFTIARNRLIDVHRATNRRPIRSDHDVPERAVRSAEAAAFENMGVDEVTRYLAVLTEEQREVISLRLVEDLSLADVASIVGRPVTAVKALQRRGLRRLQREILEKLDEGVS